jgi:hypothetical protein
MHSVSFSNNNKIINTINYDRSMLFDYLKNDIHRQNNNAYIAIIYAINRSSPHKILDIDNDEDPLKIFSFNKDWYNDKTPFTLYKLFLLNKGMFKNFVNEYNTMVIKNIDKNKSGSLEYISHKYNIRVKINAISRSIY